MAFDPKTIKLRDMPAFRPIPNDVPSPVKTIMEDDRRQVEKWCREAQTAISTIADALYEVSKKV